MILPCPVRWHRIIPALLGAALVLAGLPALSNAAPVPDPLQGDGRVSAF